MNAFLENIRLRLAALNERLTQTQRIQIIVLTVVLLAVIVTAITLVTRKQYETLYTSLSASEAGQIMTRLQELGVDAKAQNTDSILVPKGQAEGLVMQLASEGYPQTGLTYDQFANAGGFGSTDFEKKQYETYQRMENIRSLLKAHAKIVDATVIVVPEKDGSFVLASQKMPASASITLTLAEGAELTQQEAQTLLFLISRSVPNLPEENITLTDTNLRMYTLDSSGSAGLDTQLELTEKIRKGFTDQVLTLLSPVFGISKLSVQTNVVLDFDKKVTEAVKFEPPVADAGNTGIEISLRELSETINGVTVAEGVVGPDANGTAPTYQTSDGSGDQAYTKVTREVNYEVNEIKQLIESAQGTLSDLSIAIIIDNTDSEEDYTDNVVQLVVNAIGVDANRVSVQQMPFMPVPDTVLEAFTIQEQLQQAQQRAALIRMIILGASIVIAALLLFMIFMNLRKKPEPVPMPVEDLGQVLDVAIDDGVSLAEIEAQRKPSNQDVIEDFISRDPESVAALLRNWLSDDM